MKHGRRNGKPLAKASKGLLLTVMASAFCLLAVGSPAQAETFAGIFGGFGGTFPGSYINGGTLYTEDSANAFHVWSSTIVFDPSDGSIAGEGRFSMVLDGSPGGGTIVQGRWEARKLRSWKEIGRCGDVPFCLTGGPFGVEFPPTFVAGKMRAKLVLFDDDGNKLGPAELTIWCSLPGIPFGVDPRDPMRRGIEQYQVRHKGLRFTVGRSGTVFVSLD